MENNSNDYQEDIYLRRISIVNSVIEKILQEIDDDNHTHDNSRDNSVPEARHIKESSGSEIPPK